MANKTDKPALYGPWVWKIYGSPAILYGSEVISYTKTDIKKFEEFQRVYLRQTLKVPSYTPNMSVYGESNIMPLQYHII